VEDQHEIAYGLSMGTNFDDVEWLWMSVMHHLTLYSLFSWAGCIELNEDRLILSLPHSLVSSSLSSSPLLSSITLSLQAQNVTFQQILPTLTLLLPGLPSLSAAKDSPGSAEFSDVHKLAGRVTSNLGHDIRWRRISRKWYKIELIVAD